MAPSPSPPGLDLVIVGAGPAGIALGGEAVASGIDPTRVLVLEKGDEHTFSIRKLEGHGRLWTEREQEASAVCRGVLCAPGLLHGEAASYLDRAIRDHRLTVRYREVVTAIRPREGHFLVSTSAATYRTRTCAVAIGTIGRPRKPHWPIPVALEGRIGFGIPFDARPDEEILVVGGGDSASELAQFLAQERNAVVLSYRGVVFRRMNEINRASLEELERTGHVMVLRGSDVEAVAPESGRIRVLFSRETAPPILVDRIVVANGGVAPDNFLRAAGIDFDGVRPLVRDGYETTVPGLFLVGDLSAGAGPGSTVTPIHSVAEAMRSLLDRHAARVRLRAS